MYVCRYVYMGTSQVALMVKNPPASAGDIRDSGLILSPLQRSPGEGYGNPLQYSCLESPMDTIHTVMQSQA